jgi:peptidoglycan/xylan/chitin deacetylase (PgdA/CDA1 family)
MTSVRVASVSPIPILMYHQIEQAPPKGAAFRSLYVSPAAFVRQMALLSLLGYRGLSMSGLMPYLKGEKSGKVVGITFDDGFLNNLTYAMPVLKRHGFSSTCYVISQRIGQTNAWDRDKGVVQTPLMDADQLRQWLAGGQEVGAHSRRHVRLTQTDAATSQQEIALCKAELQTVTQTAVQHFCYPYGDYAPEHVAMTQAAGFESATTVERGRCRTQDDLMVLPRVPVFRATSLPQFWLKIATAYEDRRRR